MGYTYDFKNNEYYSAEDINSIRGAFITPGVLGAQAPAMKVSADENKVFVSAGMAIFNDGSSLKIDSDGVELDFTLGEKNYVYLLCDTELNKNTVNVSVTEPVGDCLVLAEIDETGAVSDRRTFAVARYAALAPQRCVVDITIPGRTKGWDNSAFIKLCDLEVDRNFNFVTAMNCYDYGSYLCRSSFINGNGAQLNLYNSNSGDDVDIQINENFEVFARAKTDYTVTLVFENMIEGSALYV